jgi:methionyl-tRNA formyltransferase
MRILIFADKDVGARCVDFLLGKFPQDDYHFVVTDREPECVTAILQKHGQPSVQVDAECLKSIASLPEGHFDWLLNLWGSQILKPEVLSRARRSLNIHPAYLPFGRGRDPVVWAIRYGHPAGVTLHEISAAVDEGPILYREEVAYALLARGKDVYARVIERCWQAFCEQWPALRAGDHAAEPQSAPAGTPTYRRSQLLADRVIDFDNDLAAQATVRRLLAHDFAPGYSAQLMIGGQLFDAALSLTPAKPASE